MSPHVLVTGGSGFIGSWVVATLIRRGAVPVVIDLVPALDRWSALVGVQSKLIRWATASLLDRDAVQAVVEEHKVTNIVHCAALLTPACQQDPWIGCQVNILGSMAVFEAARRSKTIRSISYASSYAVYGSPVDDAPASNTGPPSFYGAFKQSVDLIAIQYFNHFGISSVAIRPHVVYGPLREDGLTAGPSLAARAVAGGQEYTIGFTGRVGYDYVEDVAHALVRASLETPYGAHTVDLNGEQCSTEEFIQVLDSVAHGSARTIRAEGPSIPPNIPSEPNYITSLYPDWKATPLADGLRKTIDFYKRASQ
jgi:UDP-glucose 4-epimerase